MTNVFENNSYIIVAWIDHLIGLIHEKEIHCKKKKLYICIGSKKKHIFIIIKMYRMR